MIYSYSNRRFSKRARRHGTRGAIRRSANCWTRPRSYSWSTKRTEPAKVIEESDGSTSPASDEQKAPEPRHWTLDIRGGSLDQGTVDPETVCPPCLREDLWRTRCQIVIEPISTNLRRGNPVDSFGSRSDAVRAETNYFQHSSGNVNWAAISDIASGSILVYDDGCGSPMPLLRRNERATFTFRRRYSREADRPA